MGKWIKHIFCITAFCTVNYWANAQSNYQLEIIGDTDDVFRKNEIDLRSLDSLGIQTLLKNRVAELRAEGYWLASLDELTFGNQTVTVKLFLGKKYEYIRIIHTNLTESDSKKLALSQSQLPIDYRSTEIQKLYQKVLSYYENNGYPFAKVQLDSFDVDRSGLLCELNADPGRRITFDSVQVNDAQLVNSKFISRYLGISYDEAFSQKRIDEIEKRLSRLPFLQLEKEPGVYFGLQKAKVGLSLSKRKVNIFDGILGLIPGAENRKPELTGELNFELQNLFKAGKYFDFHWKKITTKTQQLDVSYEHPFVFGSPFYLRLSFNQLKENTAFSNRLLLLGLNYSLSASTRLNLFYENKNGNRLEDLAVDNGDFGLNNYGVGLEINTLDNIQIPKSGYITHLNAQVGLKTITSSAPNNQSKSDQYEFRADFANYMPLGKSSILFFKFSGGLLENQNLFLNDLFRLGGLKSIRGFNENFFYASKYGLVNLEWQLYLEASSYLFLFFDQALLEREIYSGAITDKPSGAGVGMKINSNGGQFSIIYGLGRSGNQGFSFDQSKIHFGYTAKF
ncbi:BamA/TamA family outer membrane protein [Reichenbachiella sp. MALMAid0571]|uniref:BamA/TamA family outer membrane protein n=1 Tax=Reichenbachiella sp. MALMAid0571 TaxID=3143939 RepID=UPI0032DF3E30